MLCLLLILEPISWWQMPFDSLWICHISCVLTFNGPWMVSPNMDCKSNQTTLSYVWPRYFPTSTLKEKYPESLMQICHVPCHEFKFKQPKWVHISASVSFSSLGCILEGILILSGPESSRGSLVFPVCGILLVNVVGTLPGNGGLSYFLQYPKAVGSDL